MDTSQYLADSPPTIVPLAIRPHFQALTEEQKLYAHHISKYVQYSSDISFHSSSGIILPFRLNAIVSLVLEFYTFIESPSISVLESLDLKLHDKKPYIGCDH